jgi:hypothetical protein
VTSIGVLLLVRINKHRWGFFRFENSNSALPKNSLKKNYLQITKKNLTEKFLSKANAADPYVRN